MRQQYDEALDLIERTITITESAPAYDSEHPLVLEAQVERLLALRGLGRLEEAEELAPFIYEARVRRLGAEHPWTLEARTLLGSE